MLSECLPIDQAIPKDIEELVDAGKSTNICPYFGSRRAIRQAEASPAHEVDNCILMFLDQAHYAPV